jgi:TPR repeat protein
MREVFSKAGNFASGLFRGFFALVLGLFVISQAARGQRKAEAGQPACVPSDLSALIVPEGGTVHVNEVMEFGKQGSTGNKTLSSGPASGSFDARGKDEAYKIFSKEARQGNPAAMTNLAVSSLAGWGGKPNAGAALYWLHAAADRGYGAAFYDLGILYFKGCGVRQDMAEAFHFFELGAQGGYYAAQVNLGYFYDHGLGVAQDHAAAAHWYLQAAEAGEAQAQYNLGDLYLHGEGVPRDESIAFTWFQKAALQGHSGGRIMIGTMLAAGRGTSKDLAGAYFWIFTAVLQGDDRGTATLRALERQLTAPEIEEAKERGRLLVTGVASAKNR